MTIYNKTTATPIYTLKYRKTGGDYAQEQYFKNKQIQNQILIDLNNNGGIAKGKYRDTVHYLQTINGFIKMYEVYN